MNDMACLAAVYHLEVLEAELCADLVDVTGYDGDTVVKKRKPVISSSVANRVFNLLVDGVMALEISYVVIKQPAVKLALVVRYKT